MVFQCLFRTSTDQSNGVNKQLKHSFLLAPALGHPMWEAYHGKLRYDCNNGAMLGPRIDTALDGRHETNIPTLFFTNTLLMAFGHALDKESKGETNAEILFIDPSNARNNLGERANFRSVIAVRRELDLEPPAARWTGEIRNYDDVYISTDRMFLRNGSRKANFKLLVKEGLYELFPALKIIREKQRKCGLETPMEDFREALSVTSQDLAEQEINVAAFLSLQFRSVCGMADKEVPMQIFAWFLALKGQDPTGPTFRKWIAKHSLRTYTPRIRPTRRFPASLPEMQRWRELYELLHARFIPVEEVAHLDRRISRKRRNDQGKTFRAVFERRVAERAVRRVVREKVLAESKRRTAVRTSRAAAATRNSFTYNNLSGREKRKVVR